MRPPSLLTPGTSRGLPEPTLRFDNFPEGLTEFSESHLALTVMVYYEERTDPHRLGEVSSRTTVCGTHSVSSPCAVTLSTVIRDTTCGVLPNEETQPTLLCLEFLLALSHVLPAWPACSLQPLQRQGQGSMSPGLCRKSQLNCAGQNPQTNKNALI